MRSPSFHFAGDVDRLGSEGQATSFFPRDRHVTGRLASRRVLPSGCVLLNMYLSDPDGRFANLSRNSRTVVARGQ